MGVNRFAPGFVVLVLVLVVSGLAACGPPGTASYRDGAFIHGLAGLESIAYSFRFDE